MQSSIISILPTIGTAIVIFLMVILTLVILLLLVKNKLSPSGVVKITINGEHTIEVLPGSSLLSTLSNEKIFLPSACGGGGTCLQCKCRVITGGGEILPTETPHFTKKDQNAHWRLGCQVKVVDECAGKLAQKAIEKDYAVVIIADHGNADQMINDDGSINTQHSTNPVPIILLNSKIGPLRKSGKLGDVAPTLLKLMAIEQPPLMNGESLI